MLINLLSGGVGGLKHLNILGASSTIKNEELVHQLAGAVLRSTLSTFGKIPLRRMLSDLSATVDLSCDAQDLRGHSMVELLVLSDVRLLGVNDSISCEFSV